MEELIRNQFFFFKFDRNSRKYFLAKWKRNRKKIHIIYIFELKQSGIKFFFYHIKQKIAKAIAILRNVQIDIYYYVECVNPLFQTFCEKISRNLKKIRNLILVSFVWRELLVRARQQNNNFYRFLNKSIKNYN